MVKGDLVEIIGFNGVNSEKVGQRAIILRESFNGYWIKFEDGTENVWRKKLLKKIEGNDGTNEAERIERATFSNRNITHRRKKQINFKMAKLFYDRSGANVFNLNGSETINQDGENWKLKIYVEVEKL